jgi:hypothetical protein
MREWLARGGEWFDATKKPVVWNLAEQLRNAGLRYPGIPVDGGGGD